MYQNNTSSSDKEDMKDEQNSANQTTSQPDGSTYNRPTASSINPMLNAPTDQSEMQVINTEQMKP